MAEPRGVEERLTWFRSNDPGGVGWCMRHSWRALGGDQNNPPRWGCPDANCVYDKVIAAGRYWRTMPPRGALVLWKYGNNGHAALSLGDGTILTTDPAGRPGRTGVEPLDYPERAWGASPGARIWTDTYNGSTFEVGDIVTGTYDYKYLGKPSGLLTVGTRYVTLDQSRWDPPRRGLEHTLVYLNVAKVKGSGFLRVRIMRADGDATAYMDFPVTGSQLITYTYFEDGDGKPTHVELKCRGGLTQAVISTRYTKKAVIPD